MNSSLEFEPEIFGEERTDKFRLFFKKILPSLGAPSAKIYISPFHDISLYSESGSNIYRMIVTQPRWTNVEYQMAADEPFNPILPVTRKERIAYVKNLFPFHGVPWNCGFLPQTWEMPSYESPHAEEGIKGTNKVLEVIEIGTRVHELGSVVDVKVLGAIALLNNREITWKIITIDINDTVASKLGEIDDIYTYMPNLLESTIDWFKYHKIPDGGQILQLANLERPFDQKSTYEKIETSHKFWKNLIKNELYFRESRDCAHFKLFNTQCLEGNADNVKSGRDAEVIVDNLKSTIGGQLIETLPQYPNTVELETVFYIDKSEFVFANKKHMIRNGVVTNEEEQDDEENSSHWRTSLKKIPFGKVFLPIALTSLAGYLIYYYGYKRNKF